MIFDKVKLRVIKHPDIEGFPDHWFIQYKKWWHKDFRYYTGYFESEEKANEFMSYGFIESCNGVTLKMKAI